MGRALTGDIKTVIFKVAEYFKQRKADKESLEYKNDANIAKIVAEVTGYCEKTVRNVVSAGKLSTENLGRLTFSLPKKSKVMKKRVDDFDSGESSTSYVDVSSNCSPIAEDTGDASESSTSASVTRSKSRDDVKKSTQRVPEKLLHSQRTGYKCNECGGDVAGFQYLCVQCAEYDVCATCEARGAHAQHYLLRAPKDKPRHEAMEVVKQIREFMNAEKQITETVPTEELLSIKCEIDIPNDPLEDASIVKIEPLDFDEPESAPHVEGETTVEGYARPAEPKSQQRRKRKAPSNTLPDTRVRMSSVRVTEVTAQRNTTQSSRDPVAAPSYSQTINEQTPLSYEVPADIKPHVNVPVTFYRVPASVTPPVKSEDRRGLRPDQMFILPPSTSRAQVVSFDPSQPAENLVIKTEFTDDS